jgi:hypothetical protein
MLNHVEQRDRTEPSPLEKGTKGFSVNNKAGLPSHGSGAGIQFNPGRRISLPPELFEKHPEGAAGVKHLAALGKEPQDLSVKQPREFLGALTIE